MAREVDQDELIDCRTLVDDEVTLVAGKRGATRLGFALLLRFYTERGRFPRGRSEIPDATVDYVARQVEVEPTEIAFYEWTGRTSKFHRTQIRQALGFRECTVGDAEADVPHLLPGPIRQHRLDRHQRRRHRRRTGPTGPTGRRPS
ncbi:DUF4158 domain-containing protein [Mycobacterium sp.]|uniref:DUF4158 domain-containing protein n=1 Tax=Mycobacterium sp. TaxID=1785 RepID=UPI0031E3625D